MEVMIYQIDNKYHWYNFLELYTMRKAESVLDSECKNCNLAYHCHPMKQIGKHLFEKYCTKDFLRYNFLKANEIL
jgi:hypothetical protein